MPLPAGDLGVRYARPEMMVLSRFLEHSTLESRLLSQPLAGRRIKRSNKDLGRVLAIAALSDLPDYGAWTPQWDTALKTCYPQDWKQVGQRTGDGLRLLLESDHGLEEALHTYVTGLLSVTSS